MRRTSSARRLVCVAAGVLLLALIPLGRPGAAAAQPAAAAGIESWTARVLPVPANDVAYDAGRRRVLATVPSSQPSVGDELVELDPATGALGRHVWVGSDPDRIALTDDGTTAYVGLQGANRIVRVDLATFAVLSSFSTAPDPTYDDLLFVEDLDAVPGRNDEVVASLAPQYYSHEGVFVFRDGVALPEHTADSLYANRIVVASATTAYGYNSISSGFQLSTLVLDAMGVHAAETGTTAITGYSADLEMSGGLLYTTTGVVLDPGTRRAVGSFPASGLLEVTPGDHRATFLDIYSFNADARTAVSVFDTTTGAPMGSRTFEGLTPYLNPSQLLRRELVATAGGFAVASTHGVLLLGPSVVDGPVALPPAPASGIETLQAIVVDLDAADLVYDEARHLVYLSVPRPWSEDVDRVVAVDVATGQVVHSLVVAGEPGPIALSDDGSRLHVALAPRGAVGQIAEIDAATFAPGRVFPLGSSTYGPMRAADLEVMPGTVDTVAVALQDCCSLQGVAIYDAGTRRPRASVPYPAPRRIEFADAATLYGAESDLFTMAVDASGIASVGIEHGVGGAELKLAGGLAYTGRVVEPVSGELLGRFNGYGPFSINGPFEAVPARQRLYAIGALGLGGADSLYEFDLRLQRLVATRNLGLYGSAEKLVATGPGLAATLSKGKLLLLNPPGAPVVHEMPQVSGPTGGGTDVALLGSGFTRATSVSFGATPAESFRVVNDETIRAVSPTHVAGAVKVTVTTPTGTNVDSPQVRFTYVAAVPHVDYLPEASSGPSAGGTVVTLYGGSFRQAQSVTFGGRPAAGFTVQSDYAIRAVSPPGTGSVPVVVTTLGGSSAVAGAPRFTYVPGMAPLAPARLLETRAAAGQVGYAGTKPAAGQVLELQVAGRGGVPVNGVGAVALNVTATEATGAGFVTVWPCGSTRPGTSTLNLERAGQTVANLSLVGLGPAGTACMLTSGGTHLIADVTGWSSAGAGFSPVVPGRLLETRPAAGQVGYTGAKPTPGQVVQLQVAGRGGVPPSGAGAVALNMTATEATGPGFVTVWPCGSPRPATSTLNLERAGQTVANLTLVGLGPAGTVCASSSAGAHLIADVTGWSPAGAGFTAVPPGRLLETRAAAGQVGYTGGKPAAGQVVQLQVAGRGGVPASGAAAVALNLTATEATGPGYVTVWPCGSPRPGTSTLNLERAGQTVANLTVAGLGTAGTVCLVPSAGTSLIADVTGWFAT